MNNDTTRGVLKRGKHKTLGQRVLAAGLAGLLAWSGALGYIADLAIRQGWATYLRMPGNAPDFALTCLVRSECRVALLETAHQRLLGVPLWVPPAAAALLMLIGLVLYLKPDRYYPSKLPGVARWRSTWVQDLTKGIGYLGQKGRWLLRYPDDLLYRHTLVVGSTGVGKTSRIIRPRLLMCAAEGRSAVIFDLKYPDRPLLESLLAFEGYRREVCLLLPYEPTSPRLPLLKGAEDPRIAMELADVVIPIKEREDVTTYYKDIERKLLATLINIEATYGEGSLGRIADLCERGDKAVHQHVQTYAPDAERRMGFFWSLSESDRAKMIAGLAGRLSVFTHPYLNRSTSFGPGEIDLANLGRRPMLFYLGINQRYLMGGAGQLYLQLVKRYLDRTLLEEAERQGGKLKVGVEIYLDEFTNLGYLPYMSDNLSTMRSRGVSYILTLQSYNQGLERYTREEIESIMANTNTWILFGAGMSDVDAQRFSKALGQASMYRPAEGYREYGLFELKFPEHSKSHVLTEVDLLSPEEFAQIPPNQAILRFSQGEPMIADFPRLDEMARGVGNPLMSRLAKWFTDYASQVSTTEQLISPYLLHEETLPQETPLPEREEDTLVQWSVEMLQAGARTEIRGDPETGRPTKISIRPVGGQPPGLAAEWERARWIKLEKGRTVVSLVGEGMRRLLEAESRLVDWAALRTRLMAWKESQAIPPVEKDGWLLLSPEDLDALGLTADTLLAVGGRQTRFANRRGYIGFPLRYTSETRSDALELA